MRYFIIVAVSALVAIPVHADTLKGGHPACLTEDLLHQLGMAVVDRDMPALEYLSGHGCVMTKGGTRASVLGSNWDGNVVHIRAYRGGKAAEAWVYRDALEGLK